MVDADAAVRKILCGLEIDVDGMEGSVRLREDLEVDSTELVEVAVAIEAALPVKIDTDGILAVKTLGELVAYVDQAPARD